MCDGEGCEGGEGCVMGKCVRVGKGVECGVHSELNYLGVCS